MAYPILISLMSFSLAGSITPRIPPLARLWALLPLMGALALFYVSTNDQIAQDRRNYFEWYRSAAQILDEGGNPDRLFTVFLNHLPAGLSQPVFGYALMVVFILGLLAFLFQLVNTGIAPLNVIPLVLLLAVTDRIFLDLALNTTRSSLAGIVFLIGLSLRARTLRVVLWVVAYGIHGKFLGLLLVCYAVSVALRKVPFAGPAIVGVGLAAFGIRLLGGAVPLPDFGALQAALVGGEPEDATRAFVISTTLSASISVQLLLGILLPAFLAVTPGARQMALLPESHEKARQKMLDFCLVATSAGLVLYPDLLLAQRIFIVPLLCLPAFLPAAFAGALAFIKLAILSYVLSGQFLW